jgi:membrane protein
VRRQLERLERWAGSSPRAQPLVTIARSAGPHELVDRGAALTYYAVLSLVPALLVVFAVIGLFGNESTVDEVLSIVREVGPSNGDAVLQAPLLALLKDDAQSGTLLGVGLIGVLWTSSAFVGSFFRASATIWGVEPENLRRAWPRRMGLTFVTLILLAVALLLIVLTGNLAASIGETLGISDATLTLYSIAKWPLLLIVLALLVALLYRVSPTRERSVTDWPLLTPGGVAAALAWVVVSVGFEVYVNALGTYDSTYGALGTTIAGLVWLWLTNLTLLGGVELDSALELTRDPGPRPAGS